MDVLTSERKLHETTAVDNSMSSNISCLEHQDVHVKVEPDDPTEQNDAADIFTKYYNVSNSESAIWQPKGAMCHLHDVELQGDKVTFVADDCKQQTDASLNLPSSSATDTENNDVKPYDLVSSSPVFRHISDLHCTMSVRAGEGFHLMDTVKRRSGTCSVETCMFTGLKIQGKHVFRSARDVVTAEEISTKAKYTSTCKPAVTNPEIQTPSLETPGSVKRYECEVCGRVFSDRSNLRKHLRIHAGDKPYSCTSCHASFVQKASLISHTRTHTGVKPYTCHVCQKTFRFSSNLGKHKRLHSAGSKPVPYNCKPCLCDVCGKTFANVTVLTVHRRIHSGHKPFVCHICDKTFSDSSQLVPHIRTHTGSRPYTCKLCDMSFSQSSVLRRHQRSHTGIRPHVCDICEKSFVQASHLTTHMITHTGERPFVCQICDKTFNRLGNLSKHQLNTHFSVYQDVQLT